jgi:hypothetical protein
MASEFSLVFPPTNSYHYSREKMKNLKRANNHDLVKSKQKREEDFHFVSIVLDASFVFRQEEREECGKSSG